MDNDRVVCAGKNCEVGLRVYHGSTRLPRGVGALVRRLHERTTRSLGGGGGGTISGIRFLKHHKNGDLDVIKNCNYLMPSTQILF